jgi:hypothetical protein
MAREQLKSSFTWVKGAKIWVDHAPMLEARENDYVGTVQHKTIKKLDPSKWGADGAVG